MKKRMKRHAVVQPLGESYRLIPLTRNQNAIVDAEDFDRLNERNWQAWWSTNAKSFYARRSYGGWMHYDILGGPGDHKNHDTLDNRKKNLRRCTSSQNCMNRKKMSGCFSRYKGVSWHKKHRVWIARVTVKRVTTHIGSFKSEIEAARAYDAAASKLHGEFAHLNFDRVD